MLETRIACDGCDGDLADAGATSLTYRLCLDCERVPNDGSSVFNLVTEPPLSRPTTSAAWPAWNCGSAEATWEVQAWYEAVAA